MTDHNKQLEDTEWIDKILERLVDVCFGNIWEDFAKGEKNVGIEEAKTALLQRFKEQDIASRIDEVNDLVMAAEIDELNSPIGNHLKKRRAELQSIGKEENNG